MICIYIADIGALGSSDAAALYAALPDDLRHTVPTDTHPERFLASTVLRTMLCAHLREAETMTIDAYGAPRLSSGRAISMSHDGHLCVLALGDAATALGVDVQQHALTKERAEAIGRRFFASLADGERLPASAFSLYVSHVSAQNAYKDLQKDAFSRVEPTACEPADDIFFEKWTRLEAILKSTGLGFEGMPALAAYSAEASTATCALTDAAGRRYTLSLAMRA